MDIFSFIAVSFLSLWQIFSCTAVIMNSQFIIKYTVLFRKLENDNFVFVPAPPAHLLSGFGVLMVRKH